MEDIEDKVLQLLEDKDFASLNEVEREMVLSLFSEETYQQQRSVVLKSKQIFKREADYLTPNPETLYQLRAYNSNKVKKAVLGQGLLKQILSYQLPLYQPGIAMLLLLIGFWLYWEGVEPVVQYVEQERIVYQSIVDTIVIEKKVEVPIETPVYVIREVPVASPGIDLQLDTESLDEMTVGVRSPAEMPTMEEIKRSFGNSAIKEDELGQFRVSM